MANAFVQGYVGGQQVRQAREDEKRNALFRSAAQNYMVNPTNDLVGQMFAQNPGMATNAIAARSQIDKTSQLAGQEKAKGSLYKMQMIRAAPPERKLALYKQLSPEDYAQVTGHLGRDPTPEEMDLFLDEHLPAAYAAAGVEPDFAGTGGAVHSTFIGEDGNVYVVPKVGGTPRNTQVRAQKFAPKALETDAGTFSYDPRTQQISAPLITEDQQNTAAARKEAATTSAATTAKATAQAAFDLPRIEQNAKQAIDVLQQLENHPGLEYITGAYSLSPIIPSTPQAAADALAQQIQGKTFLEAYQTLKGGGAITEIEGQKAEAAIARLSRKQKTEDYKAALRDLREVIQTGVNKARQQAKAPASPQVAPANEPTATNPKTGQRVVYRNGQWQPL